MQARKLEWQAAPYGLGYQLRGMDLDSQYVRIHGVYALWEERHKLVPILFGQGLIRDEFLALQSTDLGIPRHLVRVAFAAVPQLVVREGVLRWLVEHEKTQEANSEPRRPAD